MSVYPVSAAVEMAAFDALPAPVRAVLRDLPESIASPPLADFAERVGDGAAARILTALGHRFPGLLEECRDACV